MEAPPPRSRGAHVRSRRAPRQGRARETVDAIVAAAGELLVSKGYAAASTNAIARRAGVSIGSLYQYFASKQAIYRELLLRHRRRIRPCIERAVGRLAQPGSDLVGQVEVLLRELLVLHAENPPLMRAMETELGPLSREIDDTDDDARQLARLLASRPDLHLDDPPATASLLVVVVEQVSRWLAHSAPRELDREGLIRRTGTMVQALLGLPPASR